MAVNAYLVLRDASAGAGHLDSFWRTAVEAATRAADSADLSQVAGEISVPDGIVPGWYYDGSTFLVEGPLTDLQTMARRRDEIVTLILGHERAEGLANWAAGELNGPAVGDLAERAKSFSRWTEMLTRGAAVDSNLTNNTIYPGMLREASHPSRAWYYLHWANDPGDDGNKGLRWGGSSIFGAARANWIWYGTVGPDSATPAQRIADEYALAWNTRGYALLGQIITGAGQPVMDTEINWVSWLGQFT